MGLEPTTFRTTI